MIKKPLSKNNTKRRKKYSDDPRYRFKTKVKSRDRWRKANPIKLRGSIRDEAAIKALGLVRPAVKCADGKVRALLTYDLPSLCEVLGGYFPDVVRHWTYRGMFPKAVHQAPIESTGRGKKLVYTLEEVKTLVDVMSSHQEEKAYFTHKDKGTIRALRARIELTRKREGYGV